ncbi:unnamed protein product [Brassica rapa]|uniref:MATH domain-containing protein n=1 Tax=Brassica campestris TaxID=3711 RepID=A0A8D9CYE4_BRACM|nr:unnamed protein product [Brassica rapa]
MLMFIERSFLRSMKKIGENKFTWVIKNFSSLQHETFHDYAFEIDTDVCSCRLSVTPHGKKPHQFLGWRMLIAYNPSLLPGRTRHFSYRLTVVNQLSEKPSFIQEGPHWFDSETMEWGFSRFLQRLMFWNLLTSYIYQGNSRRQPYLRQPSAIRERIQVNGFQVLPSQVETVWSIFERHPDIAVGFHSKNQHLRKACMNSLLCLIETLCQSLQELSSEDLELADVALTYLKDSGFKLDWLEKKLDQVKLNKEKEMSCLAILQETEESLLNLKQKCSELRAELAETKTPLSFDDKAPGWGLSGMLPFAKLHDKDGGFLVNDELKIVAEIEALEVIGTLDESKDLLDKTCIDVNGFQVLPSQVEAVRGMFERHPDIAVEFRAKNQHLRTACMNFLLSLSEMLIKSLEEFSNEDLMEADIALTYLKDVGFKGNLFTFYLSSLVY